MATPIFQVQNQNINAINGTPASVFFPTKDSTGAPVDVSSGYSVEAIKASPITGANNLVAPVALTAVGSFAFSTTGITWTRSATQELLTPTLQTSYIFAISNDSGATQSLLATGILTVQNFAGYS